MPVVTGAATYPEGLVEDMRTRHKIYSVDANAEALKLGNPCVFNLIVLGLAAKMLDFKKEDWLKVIEETVPQKTVEINKQAFVLGYGN